MSFEDRVSFDQRTPGLEVVSELQALQPRRDRQGNITGLSGRLAGKGCETLARAHIFRERKTKQVGPLGTALAQAQWDAQGLRLHDGRQWTAFPSLDALGQALGETLQGPPLPLQALVRLAGRPALAGRPVGGLARRRLPATGLARRTGR